MKNFVLTYLIILLLVLAGCNDGENQPPAIPENEQSLQKTTLEWAPPKFPRFFFTTNVESYSILPEDAAEFKPRQVPALKRDTIRGITVRPPALIILPSSDTILSPEDPVEEAYFGLAYISTNSYFGVNFDNDIFSNTDYYYTNGIRFELVSPAFASSPFAWPMLPYNKASMNYHGLIAVQNMYTPTNPDTVHVLGDDRPFAAYLYLGHTKNTLSKERRYRQYSEIILGLLGPGSLGGFVQGQIHNIEPVGWQNQIQNDLVLNYTVMFEMGVYNQGFFDLNAFADAQIGTLYDNLGVGMRMRAGRLNPYFSMPGLASALSAEGKDALNLQIGLIAGTRIRFIGYNATLQGGLLNPNNTYTIHIRY